MSITASHCVGCLQCLLWLLPLWLMQSWCIMAHGESRTPMLKMTRNIIQHAPKPSGKRWQQCPDKRAQSTCPPSPCLPQAQKPRSSLSSPFVQDQKLAELNSLPYPHSYYSSGSAVVKCWIKCVLSNCSTLASEQIIHITVEQVVSHNVAGFCLSPSVFPDAAWALWYMHTPA